LDEPEPTITDEPEPEEPQFYFSSALFHQNPSDFACQISYEVEHAPSEAGGPRLRDMAWGKAQWQMKRVADGASVGAPITQTFQVCGVPYNMAAFPPEGTTVSVQCKRPLGPAAQPGYRYELAKLPDGRAAIRYDGALIGDENTGAGAVARPDPNWPPQPEF